MKVWLVVTDHKLGQNITAHATEGDALMERSAIQDEDTYDEETDYVQVIERPILIMTDQGIEEFNG